MRNTPPQFLFAAILFLGLIRLAAAEELKCENETMPHLPGALIEKAQQREQCVFQSGIGFLTLTPHLIAARKVARVLKLPVYYHQIVDTAPRALPRRIKELDPLYDRWTRGN